jgi:hypothetical protein
MRAGKGGSVAISCEICAGEATHVLTWEIVHETEQDNVDGIVLAEMSETVDSLALSFCKNFIAMEFRKAYPVYCKIVLCRLGETLNRANGNQGRSSGVSQG